MLQHQVKQQSNCKPLHVLNKPAKLRVYIQDKYQDIYSQLTRVKVAITQCVNYEFQQHVNNLFLIEIYLCLH